MKNQNKIHSTLKIILITLASMFITNGCERSLEPWGRIEGQLAQGRKADGNKIWMSLLPPKNMGQNNYETVCDENGRFVFNKVPSGWFEVGYLTRTGEGSASITSRTPVEVKAGETSTVILGGTGRPVTGKFVPPEGFNKSIYFGQGTRSLVTAQPEQPRPDNYDQMTKRQQQQWLNQWVQTEEYKTQRIAYLHNENWRHYTFYINEDGTFRIEDVIPGKYDLYVTLEKMDFGQETMELVEIGNYSGEIEVPQMSVLYSDEPFNVGNIVLSMYNPISVGDTAPLFEGKTIDGEDLRLIDYRGKFVLLSSWAPVFYPELQQLKDIYETYRDNSRLAIIGLSGDDAIEEVRTYVRENNIAWPVIYLGEQMDSQIVKDYGLYGSTWAFLVDPDGKIITRKLPGGDFNIFKSEVQEAIK